MSKVERGGGVRLTPPPSLSRLRLTIFSSRLLGLKFVLTSLFVLASIPFSRWNKTLVLAPVSALVLCAASANQASEFNRGQWIIRCF